MGTAYFPIVPNIAQIADLSGSHGFLGPLYVGSHHRRTAALSLGPGSLILAAMPTLENIPAGVPNSAKRENSRRLPAALPAGRSEISGSALAKPSWPKWWVWAALIGLALIWIRYAIRPSNASDTPSAETIASAPLRLRAHRNGGDIELSWNRSSPLVVKANGGILTIDDGPNVSVIPLSGDQLREGRVIYAATPQNDLNFRLEVSAANGASSVESLQVMEWDAGSVTSAEQPYRPAPPRRPKRTSDGSSSKVPVSGETERQAFDTAKARRVTPQPETSRLDSLPAAPSPEVNSPSGPPPQILQQAAQIAQPADPVRISGAPVASWPQPALPVPQPVAKTYLAPSSIRKVKPVISPADADALAAAGGPVLIQVRVKIDESGKVTSVDIVSLNGNLPRGGTHLKVATRSAAEQWKFRPATINGIPVPSEKNLTFYFR